MKRPEDLSWDRVVERIELDASDADLAAAELALRGAESDAVRPELIESVLAQAQAEAGETTAPLAMPRIRTLPRMRRFAAAAAAFFFGSKLSAATTITTLAVVTTVSVVIVRNSTWELSYAVAIESLRSSETDEDTARSAMGVVSSRMQIAILKLQATRDASTTPITVVESIRQGLIGLAAAQQFPAPSVMEEVNRSAAKVADENLAEPERLFLAQNTISLLAIGFEAIKNCRVQGSALDQIRQAFVWKLGGLLRR